MSLVGSFVNLGALLGALTGGFLMDRFGRKLVLIFLSLPFVIGWLLIAVAVHPSNHNNLANLHIYFFFFVNFDFFCHLGMLYIGRILGGAAGGIASVTAPTYVCKPYQFDCQQFIP